MSKIRAVRLGAAVLAVAGALSACSSGNSGSPSPVGNSSSSAAAGSSSAAQLAPSVPSPLPVDSLTANPCTALSADQVTQQGLTGAGEQGSSQTGPDCKWKSSTSQLNVVYISPITGNKNGLSDTYALKSKFAYFEPTTVSGYPAVYAEADDSRSIGDCSLWVGVTDQLAVSVSAQIGSGPNKSNPCPVTARVAGAMITHLQGQ
ncbi:DUF3558 domain-containing protein [Amycolatopsis acidicola]|uniref:DUF3558 domain-containing protein n=1 Tax=Amycolatopsis acidicola TaxID=2596893 RepID=A0A5N0VN90_9PSEU|nr:DUF3558 domain-containing protein [Amycolatopsis acidicola]KAA9166660.1 DUF3558 domain-containing protein [Amycolatopsis acidicola]